MLPTDSLPLAAAAAAAVAACALLAFVVWRMRKGRGAVRKARPRADSQHNREGQSLLSRYHPSAVRVLTTCERQAFDLVRDTLPDHFVMAQVPLVRYLRVRDKRTEDDWLRGLSMLSADILVCDTTSRPILAIEILPPKPGARAQERHDRMRQLLEGVGVGVLVWEDGRLPTADQARAQLRSAIESGSAAHARPASSRSDAAPAHKRRSSHAPAAARPADGRIEPELGPLDAAPRGVRPSAQATPAVAAPAAKVAAGASAATSAAAAAAAPSGTSARAAAPSGASARQGRPSSFTPLIPVPEIAELLAEGDEIAARHSTLDPVSLTFFDEFEARPQGSSAAAH
jgi:hypothetical protein